MRKSIGPEPSVFPMPVMMIAAYDKEGNVQVMNAAWAIVSSGDKVALFISEGHKTTKSIRETGAFTVSIADEPHMEAADFFGIASGNTMEDKFERTGYHAEKSELVNAPIITEFPVTMECELAEIVETENLHAVVGRVLNTTVDERVLDENGKVDPLKMRALVFDRFGHGYYSVGEKVGQAWSAGMGLMEK